MQQSPIAFSHKPQTFSILPLEIPTTLYDFKDEKSFVSYFEKSGMVLD